MKSNGHLEVAQWLLLVKPDIDISCEKEAAFSKACINRQIGIVQWFYTLNPDKYNNTTFKKMTSNNRG